MSTTLPLTYSLIMLKLIDLETVSMTWKTLRLFVNTLLADDKYSLLNKDNSIQPNPMHLSQKGKNIS